MRTRDIELPCREVDPEIFFPDLDWNHAKFAKEMCGDCPVKAQCLEAALSINYVDDWGIWGGMSREERNAIRRQRVLVAA